MKERSANEAGRALERLAEVVAALRAENGCPWDKEQTHDSLKRYCLEEAAEVVCGINILNKTGNSENLCEELGDLLLQIFLHAQIAQEEGLFTIADVADCISEKMIRRHPHVFGDAQPADIDAINRTWEEIKKTEKNGREWMEDYLPEAFDECEKYIDAARERKAAKRTAKESEN